MHFPLQEADMSPLEHLLNLTTQRYGIRILPSSDDCPHNSKLVDFINRPPTLARSITGLYRSLDQVLEWIHQGALLEKIAHQQTTPIEDPEIAWSSSKDKAPRHTEWAQHVNKQRKFRNTDELKATEKVKARIWYCTKGPAKKVLFQGH